MALLDNNVKVLQQAQSSDQRFSEGGRPILHMHIHISIARNIGLTIIDLITSKRECLLR